MDLNQLQMFVKVAQAGSFDRVAAENYVSQRAVSRLIKRLEEELGMRLFSRGSNRIKLTPAGEYFAKEVEDYLTRFSDMVTLAQKIGQEQVSHLNIGFFSAFDGVLLREQVLNYQKKSKDEIEFNIVEESVEHILSDLALKKLDCGFINNYGRYTKINRRLYDFIDVYQGEMMLTLSRQNPLAKKPYLEEKDLVGKDLLYYSSENSQYMQDTFLATLGSDVGQYQIKRVASLENLLLACSLDQGLAYLPKDLLDKFSQPDDSLVFKRFHSARISQNYTMQLVFRADDQSPALKKFTASILANREKKKK